MTAKVVNVITHNSGVRNPPIYNPYLLQTAYGSISPNNNNPVMAISIATELGTRDPSISGNTSIHKALKNKIVHNNR